MDPLTPPPAEETTTATPGSVATPEAPERGLHEMNKADRDAFLRDGKIPATDKTADSSDAKADSSTAPAEGQKAAETAAKPVKAASEPAAPAKDKKARNSEENRVLELLEDRKRADRRIADLEARLTAAERQKTDARPDPSTDGKPSEPKHKQYAADAAFPKIQDFENPDEWAAAVAVFTEQRIDAALSAKEQASAETSQVREVAQRAFNRGASEITADPTVLERIAPELERFPGARAVKAAGHVPDVNHFIKDAILFDTEKPLALLAFYSTPEGQQEWARMRGMDEKGYTRTIIARELSLGATVSQGGAATGDEKQPAAKTFTKTPVPPEKEGPKGAVAKDGAESAMQTGDFAAFQAEMDARDPASARRFGRRRAS